MVKGMRILYAVTVVLPLVHQAIVHLYGFAVDTWGEMKAQWKKATTEE